MAYSKIHAQAWCATCGKQFGNWKNAQALAAQHAKTYGHQTRGETGFAFSYGPDTDWHQRDYP